MPKQIFNPLSGAFDSVIDQATEINYSPAVSSRWDTVPALASDALDTGARIINANGKNYIAANSDFEGDANGAVPSGYVTYKDAAAVAPVDGTGGSALFTTILASTSSPLRNTKSAVIAKTANNAQGEGASYNFSIDTADQAKILRVSFDYSTSANYADGYIRVYVYDVTNSVLIEVIDRDVAANAQGQFVGSFQTSSNSTSYRLIWHIADSGSTAWSMTVDAIAVRSQTLIKGPIVTDWQSYTPTGTWVTNTTYLGKYARTGGDLLVRARVSLSGAPTGTFTMNLPSGLSIDTTRLPNAISNQEALGVASFNVAGVRYIGAVGINTSTSIMINTHGAGSTVNATTPGIFAAGSVIELDLKVPIAGWSSNQVLSEDTGNKLMFTHIARTTSQSIANATDVKLQLNTSVTDYTASADIVTNYRITVPESGVYTISGHASFAANTTGPRSIAIRIDGTLAGPGNHGRTDIWNSGITDPTEPAITIEISLLKGQYIELWAQQTSGGALNVNSANLTVSKKASPQTLAGSETVAASYTSNAGQVVGATPTVIKYEDIIFDSHAAYNITTGLYTVPSSGTYSVVGKYMTANYTSSTGQLFKAMIYKNGILYKQNHISVIAAINHNFAVTIVGNVKAVKGDTIAIYGEFPTSGNLEAVTAQNYFDIVRVGN